MAKSEARCAFVLQNGRKCMAHPRKGDTHCAFHRPGAVDALRPSRQRGGRSTAKKAVPLDLHSVSEVVVLLGDVINKVRTGKMDPKLGNTLAVLASTLIRALETGAVEARIADLETRLLRGLRS